MRRCLLLTCLLAVVPGLARADEVFLKGGGRLSGRIMSRTDTAISVDVGPGTITVPMSRVLRIEVQRSILHEYNDRAGALVADDVKGWLELASWATRQGLNTQARAALRQVLAADPDNAIANAGLGHVRLDGRWVSEAESYRLRGFVQFDGSWITPDEQRAIIEQREAAYAAELERLEALRVREAEARAAEAEARAREAEAAAVSRQMFTVPLWWGAIPSVAGRPVRSDSYRSWSPLGMWPASPLAVWPSSSLGVWPSSSLGVWPSSSLGVWPSSSLGVWPSQQLGLWPSPPVVASAAKPPVAPRAHRRASPRSGTRPSRRR